MILSSFWIPDRLSWYQGYPQRSTDILQVLQSSGVSVNVVLHAVYAGGKWTTYRLMAEDAIDKALGTGRLRAAGPCRTRELPLVGARGYTPALFTDVAQHYKVPHRPGAIDTSVARYLAGGGLHCPGIISLGAGLQIRCCCVQVATDTGSWTSMIPCSFAFSLSGPLSSEAAAASSLQ